VQVVENPKDYTQAFVDLEEQLVSYNQEFFKSESTQLSESVPLRMPWWKRGLAIISADALGAAVGSGVTGGNAAAGCVLGAMASYEMWKATGNLYVVSPSSSDLTLANFQLADPVTASVGSNHNLVLSSLIEQYGESLLTKSSGEVKDLIIAKTRILYPQTSINVNSNDFSKVKEIVTSVNLNNDDAIVAGQIFDKAKVKYPQLSSELNVVKTYLVNTSTLDTSTSEAYSTGYANIVTSSNLSQSSIQTINSSVAVAVNSNRLWVVNNITINLSSYNFESIVELL
jgi:hypothetical protein